DAEPLPSFLRGAGDVDPAPAPAAPRHAASDVPAEPAPRRRLFGGAQRSPGPAPAVEPAVAPERTTTRARSYRAPEFDLLSRGLATDSGPEMSQTVLRGNARLLEDILNDFGVKGEVREIRPGPVITLFEFEPARGVKASRVIGLADDIARSMSARSARIAVVPGRNTLGIELPNARRETVALRDILESPTFQSDAGTLPIALGKAIDGSPVSVDLARMPHLLVAGTTGSGKSVGVNAMILSLIYAHAPSELRLLMIDPKMLELSVYNGIPHLLTPVVIDPQKAVAALNWAVREMEDRYKRMADLGVRNIAGYNARLDEAAASGERLSQRVQTGFNRETDAAIYEEREIDLTSIPHIAIVVDEFADLMMVAGKEIEGALQRLAQMARAAGIHIIMATQRPSVDVVTGTIKANFPSRIGFKVASKIDSRTILGEHGAEQLLGQGDMLLSDGSGRLRRVHGAFVSDTEVEDVTAYLRAQGEPDYVTGVTDVPDEAEVEGAPSAADASDLFDKAVAIVLRDKKASTSYLQRRLQIGYNRAADLIERMEADGLISPADHAGRREILMGGGAGARR
ncbi:MAG: DNA translocase FtsK, partial [Pseudomonadota bacterium]